MAVLETSRYGALERMCLSLFHRFVCEGTLDLQVCKLKISESLFNRCILFFHDTNPGFQFRFMKSLHPTQALWMYTGFPPTFLCAKKGSKKKENAAVIGQPTMSKRTEGQLSSERKMYSIVLDTYIYHIIIHM